MRFEVPQFIEVEDKIFGPFTWKQFVYLAGGAGAAIVLFFTLPFFFFVIIGIPVMGLAGFLAFHKVNNRPFSIFLESFFHYSVGDKLYLWKKQTQQQVIHKETTKETTEAYHAPTSKKSISSLSRKLEMNSLTE